MRPPEPFAPRGATRRSRPTMPQSRWYPAQSSLVVPVLAASHFAEPFLYGFSPASDSRIAYSRVLFEHTLISYGLHPDSVAVVLKLQLVPRAHSELAPDIPRHGDLPLAGQFRLSLHGRTPIPYFITIFLTLGPTYLSLASRKKESRSFSSAISVSQRLVLLFSLLRVPQRPLCKISANLSELCASALSFVFSFSFSTFSCRLSTLFRPLDSRSYLINDPDRSSCRLPLP